MNTEKIIRNIAAVEGIDPGLPLRVSTAVWPVPPASWEEVRDMLGDHEAESIAGELSRIAPLPDEENRMVGVAYLDPWDAVLRAIASYTAGHISQAEHYLCEWASWYVWHHSPGYYWGGLFRERANRPEAIEAVLQAAEEGPEALERIRRELEAGQWEDAARREVYRLRSKKYRLEEELAAARGRLRRAQKAKSGLETAYRRDPRLIELTRAEHQLCTENIAFEQQSIRRLEEELTAYAHVDLPIVG